MHLSSTALLGVLSLSTRVALALDLDSSSPDSIRAAASTVAKGIFAYYANAEVGPNTTDSQVGTFPFPPYYWWQSGATWGAIMDYGAYTGDTSYLNDTLNAMLAQTGPNFDYVPPEQVFNEANDDQAFWAFNLLTALEHGLPLLPCPNGTTNDGGAMCPTHYLRMADNVFTLFTQRWANDSDTCGGGLRWQYVPSMAGYSYKNSISNGGFFNIAARLARYTGNATYADWAGRVWDWTNGVGFVTPDGHVYDGAGVDQNCTAFDRTEWTYNSGVFLAGAAAMADLTGGDGGVWGERARTILGAASAVFFSPFANATGVMYEPACEEGASCDGDQQSFKAYLSRWIGAAAVLVPALADNATALLRASAEGAAAACDGLGNSTCGEKWYVGGFDGTVGLGEQQMALESIQALLALNATPPAKMTT